MPIEREDIGKRLDMYVAEREEITRSASQKWIKDGCVTVNGKAEAKNYCLREGDTVETDPPEPEFLSAEPQDIPITIVYEDDDVIVVNKEKGMVVHPAPGNPDGTLVNALMFHCGARLSGINGVIRPGIVHRIDKDTSGLLIVAKNDRAHESLAEQISSHRFERCYRAIVNGNIREDEGTVDAPIGRSRTDRKKMAVVSDGRNAVTHFSVLERLKGATYIECRLETGRTHQIRVHMAHLGHPLLGDTVYGGGHTKDEQRLAAYLSGQCLHAQSISFVHPVTGKYVHIESELPPYFQTVLDDYRRRTEKE